MKFRYDEGKKSLIISEATKIEYNQCKIWLDRYVKGYQFMPAYKLYKRTRGSQGWNGKIEKFNNGQVNFGLWKECLRACQEIGVPFQIENKEAFPINRDVTLELVNKFCEDFFKDHKVQDKEGKWVPFMPYDYQIETAFKILKNRYCIGEVATSGGKSLILSIVFFYTLKHLDPDAKFLLVVPSISLVTQFYDNLVEYNLGFNVDDDGGNKTPLDIRIEEIMSDKPRKYSGVEDPNIMIACYQSLAKEMDTKTQKKNILESVKDDPKELARQKYLKAMKATQVRDTKQRVDNLTRPDSWFQQFHTIAVDEAHSCKAKSLITVMEKTFDSAYNRFGVSGTFPHEDSAEAMTIQSVLGPKVASVQAKMLQDKGKIANVSIKGILLNHDDLGFDNQLKQIRKNPNNGRKAYELEKKYIQESAGRLDFIVKLVQKCSDNTLVLFNQITYGTSIFEKLKEEIGDDMEFFYIDGSVKSKKRDEIKAEMEKTTSGKPRILVASYGTLSTGVSINAIFNIVLAESFKSEQRIIQSIGRALRLHEEKEKAHIFDLVDVFKDDKQTNSFYRHFKERCTMYNKYEYPYKIMKFLV